MVEHELVLLLHARLRPKHTLTHKLLHPAPAPLTHQDPRQDVVVADHAAVAVAL